ncbi:MAG TPA: DNA polymerase III subunit epsilon [Roseiarcus sp.]|nr:DNA polymerase III subunit epsilon [Roseiarcus sp.]
MREVVLDTETTGLDPASGHRVVEIGCVEIVNQIPTGVTFHVLVNPERDVPEDAWRVHGHSAASLADKPVFEAVAKEFIDFVREDPLVIHNAEFDIRFINAELERAGLAPIATGRVVDTLALARRKHPGAPNSLDALCDRYRIDRSRRIKHGALLDAEILVEVYGELLGGRQRSLVFAMASPEGRTNAAAPLERKDRWRTTVCLLSEAEQAAHRALVAKLGPNALWRRYLTAQTFAESEVQAAPAAPAGALAAAMR